MSFPRRGAWILLGALIFSSFRPAMAVPSPATDDLRRRLKQLEDLGNLPAAIPLYRQLLKAAPQDSAGVHGLARALAAVGQYSEIAALLEEWIDRHPLDALAHLRLGDAYHALGDGDRAVRAWQQVLKNRPPDSDLYLQISDRLAEVGLYPQAARALLEGRKVLGQDSLFGWELAQLYLRQAEFDRAVEAFLADLAHHPQRLPLVEQHLLGPMGDAAAAARIVAALEGALKQSRDPATRSKRDPLPIAALLSSCALERGQAEVGFQTLVPWVDLPGGADLLFQYADRCEAKGHDRVAARAYALFAAHQPASPSTYQALLRQARIATRLGDRATAIALYDELSRRFSDQPEAREARYNLGCLQLEVRGDVEAARASFQALLETSPRDLWTYRALEMLAECDLRQGNLESARKTLVRLEQEAPSSAYAARFRQAELRYFQADFAGAVEILETLLARDLSDPLANDALELLLRCEELQEQGEVARIFVRGHLWERQGHPEEATEAWEWLEAHGPPALRELSLMVQAQACEARRQDQEAAARYETLIQQYPQGRHRIEAQRRLAGLREQRGDLEEALKIYETALLAAPADVRAPELRLHIQRLRRRLAGSPAEHPPSFTPSARGIQ